MNNDSFKVDKPLYNHEMVFDISTLPKYIIEAITELERLDKEGDWFNYDIKFDELEVTAREFLRNNKINESDYKKLMAKYGGLYD